MNDLLTKDELIAAAEQMAGGNLGGLSIDQLKRAITVAQFAIDICLNELEMRGALEWRQGTPTLPYESDYFIESVLTRDRPEGEG